MTARLLRLQERASFERSAHRAIAAGALAGAVHHFASALLPALPLAWVVLAAVGLSGARGDRMDRVLLATGAIILTAAPWLAGLSPAWAVGLAAAATGLVLVRGRLCERGAEGQLGTPRPGAAHWVATAIATAALAGAGLWVVERLGPKLAEPLPGWLVAAGAGAVIALFTTLGAVMAHLALHPDPVEARCRALLPGLTGPFLEIAVRALVAYRLVGRELAALPRAREREDLAQAVTGITRSIAELAAEWSDLDAAAAERSPAVVASELTRVTGDAAACTDPITRRQLEEAAASLRGELEELESQAVHRERVVARLRRDLATLERTRLDLLAVRGAHTQVRASGLAAMTRTLGHLARGQREEAETVHEVTAGYIPASNAPGR